MASTFGVRPLRPLPPLPLPPPLPPPRPLPPASLPLPLPRLLLPASLPLPPASPSLPPASPPPPIDAEADEDSDSVQPPSYSPRPSLPITSPSSTSAFVEHKYHLNNNKHVPWATLKIRSRACQPTHRPYFFEGDSIVGAIELDLHKPDNIRSVEIEITGSLSSGIVEAYPFLHLSQTLWSLASAQRGGSDNRLTGQHAWPFEFAVPATVEIKGKYDKAPVPARAPGTFVEKAAPLFIQYDVVCHIRRIGLRVDYKLRTVFGWTPLIAPLPPSPLRELAYREDSSLLGPAADPAGWRVLPPFALAGTLFGALAVDVHCMLAVAQPLAFTRGTVVPLHLTLRCADAQVLALLAPAVRLLRHVSQDPLAAARTREGTFDDVCRSVAPGAMGVVDQGLAGLPLSGFSDALESRPSTGVVTELIETAVFWPSKEGAQREGNMRVLDGEICLPPALAPTTTLAHFEIWYTLAAYPPAAVGYTPADTDSLATQAVQICTAHAPGTARPRALSSPGHIPSAASRAQPHIRVGPGDSAAAVLHRSMRLGARSAGRVMV